MRPLLRLLPLLATLQALTIIEQSLHKLHRPPSANHAEVPERLESAKAALLASDVNVKAWRNAVNSTTCTVFDAVDALKLVHDVEHLREVQAMSQKGGGFDTDTYCAPGSWEAVLDGTRAWADAVALAAGDEGPAFALSRPAGHHATANVAMGFGLVNVARFLEFTYGIKRADIEAISDKGKWRRDLRRKLQIRVLSVRRRGRPASGVDEAIPDIAGLHPHLLN